MIYKSCLTLLFLFSFGCLTFGQNQSPERKLYNLQLAERSITQLNYPQEKIINEFLPEVHSARDSIAPNYPERSSLQRTKEAVNQAFYSWMDLYPSEFDQYLNYLNLYYRERKQ